MEVSRRGLRERATRMAVQGPVGIRRGLRGDPGGSLRSWASRPGGVAYLGGRGAEVDAGARPGTTGEDAERIRQLEREVREPGAG